MKKYITDSLAKLKNDALSKGIYDILKWLLIFIVIAVPTKWIPYVKNIFIKEVSVSVYLIVLYTIFIIVIAAILVSIIFLSKIKELQNESQTDELTGLKNDKALKEYLAQKIIEYRTKSEQLSVIILDIDDFKDFNTRFGFSTADQVLKKLGELLSNDKRATDETFRYFNRGDEFLVVASETNLSQALQAAERKRKLIQKNLFLVDGVNHQLTVCCGVTEFKKNDDYKSLTDRLIVALNEAKKVTGKNHTKTVA